jgi:hypothetical protein
VRLLLDTCMSSLDSQNTDQPSYMMCSTVHLDTHIDRYSTVNEHMGIF